MSQEVLTWQERVRVPFQSQLPLNPHPPFNALTGYPAYPDRFYGSAYRTLEEWELDLLWMENEHLKVAICPTLGGRVWRLIDKHGQRDVFYPIEEGRPYNAGFGYGYMGGGMEMNYPAAHSVTNMRLRESRAARHEDGSCSVTLSETERHFRTRWAFSFILRPGQARLEHRVAIENPNPWETRYHYWANAGMLTDAETVWIFPETRAATHGVPPRPFSWPFYGGQNLDTLRNVPESLGVYFDETVDGYFGYWRPSQNAGAVHFADLNLAPGKKYWSWGWGQWGGPGTYSAHHDRDGRTYGEMQSGRIIIQEHFDRFLPFDHFTWTHFWYPIREIGAFSGATADLAGRMEFSPGSAPDALVSSLALHPTVSLGECRIEFRSGQEIVGSAAVRLKAGQPVSLRVPLKAPASRKREIDAAVICQGREVIRLRSAAERPKCKDIWFDIQEPAEPPRTAQALYLKGDTLLRANEFMAAGEAFEEALELDPAHHPAQLSLALVKLEKGLFDESLQLLEKVLAAVPDEPKALYYKGLALSLLGQDSRAERVLNFALRFGYRWQCLALLTRIHAHSGDWPKARECAAAARAYNTEQPTLRALELVTARHAGRAGGDCAAPAVDVCHPLLLSERFFRGEKNLEGEIRKHFAGRGDALSEAAFFYINLGCWAEADQVLQWIEEPTSLDWMARAYAQARRGGDSAALLKRAADCNDKTGFAWRYEERVILEWALSVRADLAIARYQLGNYFAGRWQLEKALPLWEQAHDHLPTAMRCVCAGCLYRSLTRLERKEEARKWLEVARRDDPADPYAFEWHVSEMVAKSTPDQVSQWTRSNLGECSRHIPALTALVSFFTAHGRFDDADACMANAKMEQVAGRFQALYTQNRIARAEHLMNEGRYEEAIPLLAGPLLGPPNLGAAWRSFHEAQVGYDLGRCYEKTGQTGMAADAWLRAVNVPFFAEIMGSARSQAWFAKYYQALCLKKLGRLAESETYLMGLYAASLDPELPVATRRTLRDMVYRARHEPEERHSLTSAATEVKTEMEL